MKGARGLASSGPAKSINVNNDVIAGYDVIVYITIFWTKIRLIAPEAVFSTTGYRWSPPVYRSDHYGILVVINCLFLLKNNFF